MATVGTARRDHSVRNYFALAFLVSWGGILALGGGLAAIPGPAAPTNPLFPFVYGAMLAGPVAAVLLLTGVIDGRAGFRGLASHLSIRRIDTVSVMVAIFTAPLAIGVVVLALSFVSAQYRPALLTGRGPGIAFGLLVGIGAGFFEELGWTGFAIPRLLARQSVLRTGLIVGGLWALWHVLAVLWGIGPLNGSVPLWIFVPIDLLAILPVYRVLMVWVYDRTGSLALAMVMHASLTSSLLVLGPEGPIGAQLLVYDLLVGGAMWMLVAALALGGLLSRRSAP